MPLVGMYLLVAAENAAHGENLVLSLWLWAVREVKRVGGEVL